MLWSKQYYHYVVKRLARGRPGRAAAAARAPERAQPRVEAPVQRRRHLDAGQVGVPVVRRVGPGVPHGPAGAGRFRVRQGPAHADAARVVHASQRAAAGLRMGAWRRESAGARLGGVARLQDREEAPRRRRSRSSSNACSRSCCSTSPGGSTARTPRAATSSRAASSAWTTSACSTARSRCRPAARCSSRMRTSWMAMYSLNLLAMAMELAHDNPAYEDLASKFWEHFVYIGHAMGHQGKDKGLDLWDEEDGFFYDCLRFDDGTRFPLKVRSMVGLIPLFAVETLEPEMLDRLPGFKRRLDWFVEHRHDLTDNVACMRTPGTRRAAAALGRHRRAAAARAALHARRGGVPVAVRHPRAVAVPQGPAVSAGRRRPRASRGLRAGRVDARGCLAATPTGADRSGFR